MEQRNSTYLIPILTAVSLAFGLYMGNALAPKVEAEQSIGEIRYQKMQDIIKILDNRYVDSVDANQLFEQTIADMLHSLDPHSNYIPAKDLALMNEAIEGKFGGVGVRFFIIRDTLCITNVLPDSPSEMAGVRDGDRIIEIEGEKIAGVKMRNEDVMSRLKGIEGTDVNITVLRNGKRIKKTIVRGSIPVRSVSAYYMLDDETGYVKIDNFSIATAFEFRQATDVLIRKGMSQLVLDLRNNGGGVLTGATEIADEFLEEGTPIVETRGENSPKEKYTATAKGFLKTIGLVVLLNSNSASASEILAGAIQDNDRGTILGRRSFGKGLVQEDYMLKDGSTLRLTTARYYTPTGRCIQKPYSEDYDAYYHEQNDRYENGELYKIDSTLLVDSLKFTTPKGKVVYGGGGIMPDVFVPYDTVGRTWLVTELRYSSSFNTFAFDFVSTRRNRWKSPDDFAKSFFVSDALLESFLSHAEREHKVTIIERELNQSRTFIKRILKAEIARQLWVEQGFYRVFNEDDEDIIEALKSFN